MILAEVKPREDGKYDIYVSEDGEPYVNSSQGYENVEDAEALARKLWPKLPDCCEPGCCLHNPQHGDPAPERVVLRVKYRNGQTKTEQLR